MAQPDLKDNHQQPDTTCCAKLTSTEDLQRSAQPKNRKATLVTEISTVQKVVHMIDKEHTTSLSKHSVVPGDCHAYRLPNDNSDRRIEFIVQNKSESTCGQDKLGQVDHQ
uniref:Uncharacterized protein n=1 Tax=Bracon brevicornis TaxID=1563983 RepID=A0A6V7KDK6_9HYME